MIDAETRILLGAYWDGELSPGEALAMERRLSGGRICAYFPNG